VGKTGSAMPKIPKKSDMVPTMRKTIFIIDVFVLK
jgi:hypothetical protein